MRERGITPRAVALYERSLFFLVVSVLVGGVGSALVHPPLLEWLGPEGARNVTLAIATTLTAATHARLVHGQPLKSLVPTILVSGPLVYGAMRAVHLLVEL